MATRIVPFDVPAGIEVAISMAPPPRRRGVDEEHAAPIPVRGTVSRNRRRLSAIRSLPARPPPWPGGGGPLGRFARRQARGSRRRVDRRRGGALAARG